MRISDLIWDVSMLKTANERECIRRILRVLRNADDYLKSSRSHGYDSILELHRNLKQTLNEYVKVFDGCEYDGLHKDTLDMIYHYLWEIEEMVEREKDD